MPSVELSIAITALVVSCSSVYVAHRALRQQRKHDQLSVRPLPEITGDPYEAHIVVRISNNGIGPLFIRRFTAMSDHTESAPSLFDCMLDVKEPACITYWSINLEGRAIAAGDSLILIKVESNEAEPDPESHELRESLDRCRADLASTQLELEYTDIYNSKVFPTYRKELSFFAAEEKHD